MMKRRRLFALLLALVMVISLAPMSAFAADGEPTEIGAADVSEPLSDVTEPAPVSTEYGEEGYTYDAATNTYTVYTADGLFAVAGLMNDSDYSANITLAADIVLNENLADKVTVAEDGTVSVDASVRTWTPIGENRAEAYNGTFDGGNHTITGLYSVITGSGYSGLIGFLAEEATVKNVKIHDFRLDGRGGGTVVGMNRGKVSGCSISGSGIFVCAVNTSSTSTYFGGIVAFNYGTVENCSSSADLYFKGTGYFGGIVGTANYGSSVTGCYRSGTLEAECVDTLNVGGIVGDVLGDITDCHNSGDVYVRNTASNTAVNVYVGGIAGNSNGNAYSEECGNITCCSNSGSVEVVHDSTGSNARIYVGGIGGQLSYASVTGCYNTGSLKAENRSENASTMYACGIGYTDNSTVTGCYNTGSVESDKTSSAIRYGGGTVTDCYYLDGCVKSGETVDSAIEGITAKTEAQFASGEVAYLLNGDQSTITFKQTLGENGDAYPGFTGGTVYRVGVTCTEGAEAYANTQSNLDHNYTDGICTLCGIACDHSGSTHTAVTDKGDGTHGYACTVCGAAVTGEHTMDITTGKCVCGAAMTAIATVTDGTNTCYAADADTLNRAVTKILTDGSRTFTVELPADAEAGMITAIRRAICDTEGVDDGSIHLTLKGVTSIPDNNNNGTGFGDRWPEYDENNVEIVSIEEVTQLASVNLPDVTHIGARAFYGCSNLTSITAPKVQSIGDWGLQGTAITSVDMPLLKEAGYCAFFGLALTEVSLPSLEKAGNAAFSGCEQLRTVDLPKLQALSTNLFYNCTSLVSVNVPAATSMGSTVFKGCANLQDIELLGVTELTFETFAGCTGLDHIALLSVITEVNANLFAGEDRSSGITLTLICGQERADTLPATAGANAEWAGFTWREVRIVHRYVDGKCAVCGKSCPGHTGGHATCTEKAVCTICGASYGYLGHTIDITTGVCTSCGEVASIATVTDDSTTLYASNADTLNQAVTEILQAGSRTFTVELPSDAEAGMITAIRRAICDTWGVADGSIHLTLKGVTTIPADDSFGIAFGSRNIYIEGVLYKEKVTQLASVNLPDVTEIGAQAFNECSNLTSVYCPKATTIESNAFSGCGFSTIVLPEATSIGDYAFADNPNLVSFSAPKATSFGSYPWGAENIETSKLETLELTAAGEFTIDTSRFFAYTPCEEINLVLNLDKKDQVTQNDDGTAAWTYTYIDFNREFAETKTFKSITFTCLDGTTNHSYTYTNNGDGTHDTVCGVCGQVEVDNEAHTPAENTAYTDNRNGTHSFTCAVCGNVTEEHTFDENDTCICGATWFAVSGSTLTIDGTLGGKTEATEEDVTRLVNKIKECVDNGITTVTVTGSEPARIEMYSFSHTAICEAIYRVSGSSAYDGYNPYNGKIDLTLSDVTQIAEIEFYDAYALNSITLPKVTTVGNGAFYRCRHLKKITFGSVVTTIDQSDTAVFDMVGSKVGGCDLILNCGQLQAEDTYKPDLENNVWFKSSGAGNVTWKSITLTHTLTYSADGNILSETCACGHQATATVTAENAIYNGTAQETAGVSYSDGWMGGTLTVSYENNTKAGTAAAQISLGEATAAASFTIAPKELTLKLTDCSKTYDGTADLTTFTPKVEGFIFYDEGSYENDILDYDDVYDDVRVDTETLTVTLPDCVPGVYENAKVSGITLIGEAAANYTLAETLEEVPISDKWGDPFRISEATVTITSRDQNVELGAEIDQNAYTVEGLPQNHEIRGIVLEKDGNQIMVNADTIVIVNAEGEQITEYFNINVYSEGILTETCVGHTFNADGFCAAGECDNYQSATAVTNEWGETVYEISNAGQLYWYARQINDFGLSAGAVLTKDIVVPADAPNWIPIGGSNGYNAYTQSFDGQNHTISGLRCETTGNYAGLFGYTDYNYTIQNIGILNSSFKGTEYVGALIGCAYTTVINCYALNTTVEGTGTVGGLIGYNGGSVTNSYTNSSSCVGSYNSSYGTVENCYYLSETETEDGGKTEAQFAGGEVAYLLGDAFGQAIGTDAYPVLGGKKVYQIENTGCPAYGEYGYSNEENTVFAPAHEYDEGVCDCGTRATYTVTVTELGSLGGNPYLTNTEKATHGRVFDTAIKMGENADAWYTDVVKVKVGDRELVKGEDYTYNPQSVYLTIFDTSVTGPIEIFAQVNAKVTFELNGGDVEPGLKKQLVDGGLTVTDGKITMPLAYGVPSSFGSTVEVLNQIFLREGYCCTGLKNGDAAAVLDAPVNNCTLTVQWEAHSFTNGACVCGKQLFYGTNMTLGNTLDLNFAIEKSLVNDEGIYAIITRSYSDGRKAVTSDKLYVNDWDGKQYEDLYLIIYPDLAAKEMCDTVSVTVYDKDGKELGSRKDSIRSYAMRNFDEFAVKYKRLFVEMLDYGAEAQKQFDYNTKDLANNQLTDTHRSHALVSKASVNKLSGNTENYIGTSLVLVSRIEMQMGFKGFKDSLVAAVTYTDHYGNSVSKNISAADFVKYNSDVYAVPIPGVVVADGRQMITVTVKDGDTVVASATDSIESYVARMTDKGALYQAILDFSDAAYASFHEEA